jgi:hypothetical protein
MGSLDPKVLSVIWRDGGDAVIDVASNGIMGRLVAAVGEGLLKKAGHCLALLIPAHSISVIAMLSKRAAH